MTINITVENVNWTIKEKFGVSLKTSLNPSGETISNQEFYNHFKNLISNIHVASDDNTVEFLNNFYSRNNGSTFDELDRQISIDESVG